jgi:hypothetical protein
MGYQQHGHTKCRAATLKPTNRVDFERPNDKIGAATQVPVVANLALSAAAARVSGFSTRLAFLPFQRRISALEHYLAASKTTSERLSGDHRQLFSDIEVMKADQTDIRTQYASLARDNCQCGRHRQQLEEQASERDLEVKKLQRELQLLRDEVHNLLSDSCQQPSTDKHELNTPDSTQTDTCKTGLRKPKTSFK